MAIQIAPLTPSTPPTTAIQDPAARQFANAVADILRTAQSPEYAVQQMSRAAGAMSGGSVPPSIAAWLFSSELYRSLTRAIEAVDVGAKQAIVAEAVARAEAISQAAMDAAEALVSAITTEADARAAALLDEAAARTAAIASETADRIAAVTAEANARAAAILAEQTARADALLAEALARGTAITAEATLRQSGDDQLAGQITTLTAVVDGNAAAIQTEATTRATEDEALAELITTLAATVTTNASTQSALVSSEATARADVDEALSTRIDIVAASADSVRAATAAMVVSEVTARADADSAIAQEIVTLTASVDDNAAAIQAESTARAAADAAEAVQRNLLAAQFRGEYTGTDLSAVTSGLLYQERIARATADEGLSQQITLLSAGAGEQFDYKQIFYFDSGVESWTGNGAPSATGGWLRPADHGSDPYVDSPAGLAVAGATYQQVRLRVRKFGTPTWEGFLWWRAAGDGTWDTGRRVALTEPTYDGNGIGLVTVTAEWSGTIDRIRIDLSAAQTSTDRYEIDWVAIGRPSPGASTAALLAEQIARANADSAEVTAREALSSVMTGTTNPAGLTLATLTAGLVFDERQARATQDTALATSISTLTATVTNNNTTQSAAVTAEATTRANADSSLASQISTVSATAGAKSRVFAQGTAPTADNVNDLWYHTGEGNKAYRWNGSAWVATDDTRIAANAASIVTEQAVRANADSAQVSRLDGLEATVNHPTTGVSATSSALDVVELAVNHASTGNTALGTRASTLESAINHPTTGLASKASVSYVDTTVATETTARAAALALIQAEVDANEAAVLSEATTRATEDESIASRIDVVSATADAIRFATAALAVSETVARATQDSAFVTRFEAIEATVDDNTAAITAEETVRADAVSALTSQINTVSSVANGRNRTFRQASAPTGAVTGDLWLDSDDANKAYRYDGASWIATSDTRIASNEAAIVTEAATRATNDSALVQAINTAWAITGATSAISQSGSSLITNWTAGQANYWNNLHAEVFTSGGQTIRAALAAEATVRATQTGDLYGQWTVKLDLNGYVAGFGLASESSTAGGSTSSFIIRADRLAVVPPDTAGADEIQPFAVNAGVLGLGSTLQSAGHTISNGWSMNPNGSFSANGMGNQIIMSPEGSRIVFNKPEGAGISFAVDELGNAIFGGSLMAATGTFAGSLQAGVLDASVFNGFVQEYGAVGATSLSIPAKPAEWSAMGVRITVLGGGGGGGATIYNWGEINGGGGGGGGAGSLVRTTVHNVTPGHTIALNIGGGGAGGVSGFGTSVGSVFGFRGSPGGSGGATTVHINGALVASATGGSGGEGGGGNSGGGPFGTQHVWYGTGGVLNGGTAPASGGWPKSGGAGGASPMSAGGSGGSTGVGGAATGHGGGGGGGAAWGYDWMTGGVGSGGYVILEFFDPNAVVTNTRYQNLITWLDGLGHGDVPTNAR